MANPLSELITWNFRAVLGLQASRYGTFEGKYYKQYIPNGLVNDQIYPPREITKTVYDSSERMASALKEQALTRGQ